MGKCTSSQQLFSDSTADRETDKYRLILLSKVIIILLTDAAISIRAVLQPRNFAYICSRRPPEWRNGRRAGPILCCGLGRPQTPCGLPPFRIFPLRFKIHGSAGSLVRTSSSAVAAGIRKICIFAAVARPSGGMVDALDSKSCVLKRRVGSIPTSGTNKAKLYSLAFFYWPIEAPIARSRSRASSGSVPSGLGPMLSRRLAPISFTCLR